MDNASSTGSSRANIESSAQSYSSNDVAIVGMACRTAGAINTPEELWEFLLDKKHGSGEVPLERWEPWLLRDPRNAKEIEATPTKGYFVDGIENFDAHFFGISPKEAEQMDPHQRLALELSWEALEHAGINPKTLAKSDTAVYMGIDSDDYSRLVLEDLPNIEPWMGIGTAAHGVANRVSYHLDLMGPSAAVDAACASSLVAVHCGKLAIQLGESKVALVGGVNVLLAPALTRMLDKAGALSHEGVCRSFDDAANGYARGEGGAVLVLKHLPSAIQDGDYIWSVLKGTAIAQDGKTNGIMAPNPDAQELVGRKALKCAGIDPSTVGFVEAHATSTALGDPTELLAIDRLYGSGSLRSRDTPCRLGSIKPNVGHLEAAAGAIGLIKAVLSVSKGQLAPQTLLETLNTRFSWESSNIEVVRETTTWTEQYGPRRAAICSYGYGGTVSHAIIEEYRTAVVSNSVVGETHHQNDEPVLLPITAPLEKRLVSQASFLAKWLAGPDGESSDLRAVTDTLMQRRALHDHRVAIVVRNKTEAVQMLQSFASKDAPTDKSVATGRSLANSTSAAHVTSEVWVFSGHGAQWTDMGKDLLLNHTFLNAVQEIDLVVQEEAGFSVLHALKTGDFAACERAQVATFTVQYGLSQVLQSRGLRPKAVLGHSVGEVAASTIAGCITPREGAIIVTRRAKLFDLVRQNDGSGAMALVSVPFHQAQRELGSRSDLVAAIDSSPRSCVISGHAKAVEQYVEDTQSREIDAFYVNTDIAFHSPMLDQLRHPFRQALAGALEPKEPSLPVYSTSLLDPRGSCPRDAEYWINNMIKPVRLQSAVLAAAEDGHRIFLEVSSHPIVLRSVRESLLGVGFKQEEFATIGTMKRGHTANDSLSMTMANLFVHGVTFGPNTTLGTRRHWPRNLPSAPWHHKPYYRKVKTGAVEAASFHDAESHNLLGCRIHVAGKQLDLYTTKLSIETKPYPGNHPLDGTEIIPAGVYINTFYHATKACELSNVQLNVPVAMTADVRALQVLVHDDNVSLTSSSHEKESRNQLWVEHATCKWSRLALESQSPLSVDIPAIQRRAGTKLPNSFAIDFLFSIGVSGIAFPWEVLEHYGNENEMIAKVDMLPGEDVIPWDALSWAPLLDAATSVGSSIFFKHRSLRIISRIEKVQFYSQDPLPKLAYLHIEQASSSESLAAHVHILSESGEVLGQIRSMVFSEVEGAPGLNGTVEGLVHNIEWIPAKFNENPRRLGNVLIVSEDMQQANSVRSWMQSATSIHHVSRVKQLVDKPDILIMLHRGVNSIVYMPSPVNDVSEISAAADRCVWEAASLLQLLLSHDISEQSKMFILTTGVHEASTPSALAQGSLLGLGRIIAAEHPGTWGGLIDSSSPTSSCLIAMEYVHDHDIVRNLDGLPRRAIMRPLSRKLLLPSDTPKTLVPKSQGTYVITGGLGSLGLETADFLVRKGARRVLLVSRREFPRRSQWLQILSSEQENSKTIRRIQAMEKAGAAVSTLALDIAGPGASQELLLAIDRMQLPQVVGVVHCAGVLEDCLVHQTTEDSFQRVMAPKVRGALALHDAFAIGSLDFFVLYSSIGQIVGTAGQASYGAGNSFLDTLAVHRRARGDNCLSLQFTAWRDSTMGSATEFLKIELESKGITDISSAEAFRAWEHLGKFDIASAVVTRCCSIDDGGTIALPILEEVVLRHPHSSAQVKSGENNGDNPFGSTENSNSHSDVKVRPSDPEALRQWIEVGIQQCIAEVLMMSDISDVDISTMMNDMGIDSVMTIALRKQLQDFFKLKVPPTLTWKYPTVAHMVPWFLAKLVD